MNCQARLVGLHETGSSSVTQDLYLTLLKYDNLELAAVPVLHLDVL